MVYCGSGVSWPLDVDFAAHQLGESLTVVWKHPPCDQTNYISGYVIAYRKLSNDDSKCDSSLTGRKFCHAQLHMYLVPMLKPPI